MIKTKDFMFSLKVKISIKVEEVKKTDYGKKRYVKQLVNAFDQDQEALRIIALTNFIDFYCGDYREELKALLGKLENEQSVFLRVAQKCSPEVSRYFSDLFAPALPKETAPGDKNQAISLAAEPGEEPAPGEEPGEKELARRKESEWVFGELLSRLCTLSPVKAAFSELPLEKMKPSRQGDRPGLKKGRLDLVPL